MISSHITASPQRTALLAAVVGAACLVGLAGGRAQDGPAGAPLPADLALVPPNALGFVHVNAAALLRHEVGKNLRQLVAKELGPVQQQFEKRLGLTLDDLDRATLVLLSPKDAPLAILTTLKPAPRERILGALIPEAKEHQYKGKTYYTSPQGERLAVHFADERTVLIGQSEDVVQYFKKVGRAGAEGPLTAALRRADGKNHVVAGLVVPEEFVNELEGQAKRLATERMSDDRFFALALMETVQPFLDARTVAVTAQLGDAVGLKLHVAFPNEKAAKEAQWAARDLLAVGRMMLRAVTSQVAKERGAEPLVPLLKEVETALRTAAVEPSGDQLQVAVTLKADAATVATTGRGIIEATRKVQVAGDRMRSANNLKQIGLAMHSYHDTHGQLPPHALYSKDGKPLLSWRVAILPFLEQDNLYKQFRLDEPWDSAHNKALLKQMPPIYAPLGAPTKEPGMTYYQGFVGKNAVFDGKTGVNLLGITDGTSNTLLVAEAAEAVLWTKPDDLRFDPKKPLPKLGGHFPEGFHAAFCDGSVRFLGKGVREATLRALITRDGGEVVDGTDIKE